MDEPIRIGDADAFVAHLRRLPDDEAVALATHAVRTGLDKEHNRRVLFRSMAFLDWILDMDAKGLFGTPITAEQVRAELDARDKELYPEAYEEEQD